MNYPENRSLQPLLAPEPTGSGGKNPDPFAITPLPKGMVRQTIQFDDGRAFTMQGTPQEVQRAIDAVTGKTPMPATPTPLAAPPTASTPETPSPAIKPPTRPTTRSGRISRPSRLVKPIVTVPTPEPTLPSDDTTVANETQVIVEPLPTQPGWVRKTSTRIQRTDKPTQRVIGAFLLGALLTGLGVAIYSETRSKPSDGTITSSFSIPIGQCENVPGNSIALGYFLTVNGVTYNSEKDPNEGVVTALNSPAKVCTSTDDKQPTFVVVVSDGQASLYRRFAEDISQMQDNGCINNSGCRRVIAVVK